MTPNQDQDALRQLFEKIQGLNQPGSSNGPVSTDDEGELHLAITADHEHGIVQINFLKPVTWFGMSVKDARDFAQTITAAADKVEARLQAQAQ